MLRFVPVLLVACAGPPGIQPCDPLAQIMPPEYLRVGNDDLMLASVRYAGCDEVRFHLCSTAEDWLTPQGASLQMATFGAAGDCEDEIFQDEPLNLRPVREQYQRDYGVDEATIVLTVGEVEVDYSFSDAP
ncbi:MAG: hypothetical protein H6737_26555 [Alphaproteobacteria bacterium]|nr:hypothetical protein [Alphaproteobacteria bacterium]